MQISITRNQTVVKYIFISEFKKNLEFRALLNNMQNLNNFYK